MTNTELNRLESSPPDPPASQERSDPPWASVGVVVFALVTGAFVTGWHFGRRWGRLVGW
jgi:hypothetical protein